MAPFVSETCREYIGDAPPAVALSRARTSGDRCYIFYRELVRAWKARPKWTTADELLAPMVPDPVLRAKVLAFAVFFNLHVMPYEKGKRGQNGEVK